MPYYHFNLLFNSNGLKDYMMKLLQGAQGRKYILSFLLGLDKDIFRLNLKENSKVQFIFFGKKNLLL